MPERDDRARFEKESDLCAAFVSTVPKNWVIYPETGGFDLVLVEEATGVQIGIEAKLALNAKVIKNNCANRTSRGTRQWRPAGPTGRRSIGGTGYEQDDLHLPRQLR